jgi:hypothetical protein
MKYYKAIFNLSKFSKSLDFTEPINYDEFELQKLNNDKEIEIEDKLIFGVDVEDGKEELDVNLSHSGTIIVSDKFKSLLLKNEATFFPIGLEDYKTKNDYFAMKLNIFLDCVKENESELDFWTSENTTVSDKIGKYKKLNRFCLDLSKINSETIFRLKKYNPTIIVNENFKTIFIENKLKGLDFTEIPNG